MDLKVLRLIIQWALIGVLLLCACVAPWFFGAWEMWWFWPFVVVLAAGCIFAGLAFVLGDVSFSRQGIWALCMCLPFCLYILLRWWFLDVVFLDAQRAILLHVTGIFVAALVVFWVRGRYMPLLFWSLFVSLLAMSVYGILNHVFWGSRLVLWAPRYEQYAGRATGPYFCPDHFAGAMELLVCMGLGLILDRAKGKRKRAVGLLAIVLGSVGAIMSLSRGSGMTLAVVLGLVVVVGFYQWPASVRNGWRAMCVCGGVLILLGAFGFAQDYRERFVTYGGLHQVSTTEDTALSEQVVSRLLRTSRGRMYTGAWLAWQTSPWLGVGPGMQRNLWLAFAHSGDGDRETGTWPTLINDTFHSYEVHSDWLELLQEHGVMGVVLFLLGFAGVVGVYFAAFRRTARNWRRHELDCLMHPPPGYAMVLAGFLSIGAMAFHSLGDFNLQMPGTVWMLALLVGLGIRGGMAMASGSLAGYDRE